MSRDDPIFMVGDEVETRIAGRHGWHEGVISKAEFVGDFGFQYEVEERGSSAEVQQRLKGLAAGNIRNRTDGSQRLSPMGQHATRPRFDDFAADDVFQSRRSRGLQSSTIDSPGRTQQAFTAKYTESNRVVLNVPLSVVELLRTASERGIDATAFFAPDGGWGPSKRRLLERTQFKERFTHLALGLAVGRPLADQMAIEMALSTEALDAAATATTDAQTSMIDVDLLAAAAKRANSDSLGAPSVVSSIKTASFASDPTVGAEQIPILTTTKEESTGGDGRMLDSTAENVGIGERQNEFGDKPAVTWAKIEQNCLESLRSFFRVNDPAFHAVRRRLLSKNISEPLSAHFSDPSIVGAAAAAEATDGALPQVMISVEKVERAFSDAGVAWPRVAQALCRRSVQAREEDPTPREVPAAALKRILLSLKLTHMLSWDEWFEDKKSAGSAVGGSLLNSWKSCLAGLGGDADVRSLLERVEQLPHSAALESEDLAPLIVSEARAFAKQWIDSSEGRHAVNKLLSKALEEQRQENQPRGGVVIVSLFQAYQCHVAQWKQLRRQADEIVGTARPPSLNEFVDRFADPTGERRRACRAEAMAQYAEALLASNDAPLVEVLAGKAPRWRGHAEVERCVAQEGSFEGLEVVRYRPLSLTKKVLGCFLDDKARASMSFLAWLNEREEKRKDVATSVKEWSRKKESLASAKAAGGECVAVLCMNATETNGGAPTLDAHLKKLVTYSEDHRPGGFIVRRPTRHGLNIHAKIKELAEQGTEVPPIVDPLRSSNVQALREGLRALLRPLVFDDARDVAPRVPAKQIRALPGALAPRPAEKALGPHPGPPPSHAAQLRACLLKGGNDVSVRLRPGGLYHPARIIRPSPGHETSKARAKHVPLFYDVKLLRSSRAARLDEEVDSLLRRCSAAGESYAENIDSDGKVIQGKVHVDYLQPDEEKGLHGQGLILDELGDRLMADVSELKKLPWIGTLPPPGTHLVPSDSRKTHTYIVSKKLNDDVLRTSLVSFLADPGAATLARELGEIDMNITEAKVGELSPGTVKAVHQHRLLEKTDGLFAAEIGRQEDLAKEITLSREKAADKAFREWARTKDIEMRRNRELQVVAEKELKASLKEDRKQRKAAHRLWLERKRRGLYLSASGELTPRPNINERFEHKEPWCSEVTAPF